MKDAPLIVSIIGAIIVLMGIVKTDDKIVMLGAAISLMSIAMPKD